LMQSVLTCRQPLAQPTLATGLSHRSTEIERIARPVGTQGWAARSSGERCSVRARTDRLQWSGRHLGFV
jgi:hypothetical protein